MKRLTQRSGSMKMSGSDTHPLLRVVLVAAGEKTKSLVHVESRTSWMSLSRRQLRWQAIEELRNNRMLLMTSGVPRNFSN